MAAAIRMGHRLFAARGRSYVQGAWGGWAQAVMPLVGAAPGRDHALQEQRNAHGS